MTLRPVPADAPPGTEPITATALAAAAELGQLAPSYRAVVPWLSTHVAALEHVIYPAARRVLPAAELAGQLELTRRLEHVLLLVHQSLNGDGRGRDVDVTDRLRNVVDAHVAGLTALVAQLEASTTAEQWSALVERHDAALRNAPSRPHPHTPHGHVGERLAFVIAGAVDRLLDALDSRVVPALPAQ